MVCAGYLSSNFQCETIRNDNGPIKIFLTPTTPTIDDGITRIKTAKQDIKSFFIDNGIEMSDDITIELYSIILNNLRCGTMFNKYNHALMCVGDQTGLKDIGWNSSDIEYFRCNNIHYKNEDIGDIYTVSEANKAIKITSKDDIATYKDNTDFKFCPKFDNVDGANFDFMNCSSLIGIPKFDTRNATDLNYMFYKCSSLVTIPKFDKSNLISMEAMFYGCTSLLSVPEFYTDQVDNMNYIFSGCKSLTTLGGFLNLKTNLDLSSSTKLTHDSLMNVINKAADVTSSPKTLTLGSTNLAKLTTDEKAIATNKGWTLK